MKKRVAALGFVATATIAASAAGQSVLVYDDTSSTQDAVTAAERLGFDVTLVTRTSGFATAYGDGSAWDLVVMDTVGQYTPAMQTVLAEQIADYKPVIFSYGRIAELPDAATALGLTCSEALATHRNYVLDPAAPANLFEAFGSDSLVGVQSTANPGALCTADEPGYVFARLDAVDGDPGILTSLGGRVMYNAIVPNDFRDQDADADGVTDMVEVFEAEMRYMLGQTLAPILVLSDSTSDAGADFAAHHEVELIEAADATAAIARIEAAPLSIVVIEYSDLSDAATADAALTVVEAARDAGTPVAVFTSDLDASEAWRTHFGVTVADDSDTARLVSVGGGVGRLLFEGTEAFNSLAVGTDGAGDSNDAITDAGTLDRLAHYDSEDGPVSMIGLRGERAFVLGGYLLDEVGADDGDTDGTVDRVELLDNIIAYHGLPTGEPALIYSDVADWRSTDAYALCEDAGYFPVVERSAAGFHSAVTAGGYMAYFVEAAGVNVAPFEDPLTASALDLLVGRREGLIVSSAALDAMPSFAAALEVEVIGTRPRTEGIEDEPANLQRLFAAPNRVNLLTSTGAVGDNDNDALRALTGSIAARYVRDEGDSSPAGAIAVSRGSLIVVNAFDTQLVGRADTNANGRADMLDVLYNELRVIREPLTAVVFDRTDVAEDSLFAQAVVRAGLVPTMVTTEGDLLAAIDAGGFSHLLVDASETTLLDSTAVQDALMEWGATGAPMLLAYEDFDSHPDFAATLGFTVTADRTARPEIMDDDAQDQFYEWPFDVDLPIDYDAAYPDSDWGDEITPLEEGVTVVARYRRQSGPGAAALSNSYRIVINTFTPRALSSEDTNGDAVSEPVAYFANQLSIITRLPALVIDFPETANEGESIPLTTAASFDPSSEALTTHWDLNGDGDFGDATGTSVTLPGAALDGPDALRIGAMVVNESGLSRSLTQTIAIANVAPTVNAGADIVVQQGESAHLVATASDVPGDALTYTWDLGEGTILNGPEQLFLYTVLGTYDVTLTVMDDDGGVATDTLTVTLNNRNPAVSMSPVERSNEGDTVAFAAVVSDIYDDAYTLLWDFGDGETELVDVVTADHTYATTHVYQDDGSYRPSVVVTDEYDGAGNATVTATVDNVAPVITSEWPGAPDAAHAQELTEFVYDLEAFDPGTADEVAFALVTGPAGMTVSPEGALRWTAGEFGYEDASVRVRVVDGDGGVDTQAFDIVVDFRDDDGGTAPDTCEEAYGLDTSDPADDVADPDGDGLPTNDECLSGTDPTVFSGPAAPVLVSPIDGVGWRLEMVELVFENAVDPLGNDVSYEVEVYADEAMEDLVVSMSDIDEEPDQTSVRVEGEFGEDLPYYWRARGISTLTFGQWSEHGNFLYNRDNEPPTAPELISPNGVTTENPPTLRIGNASDPEGEDLVYQFQVYLGTALSEESLVFEVTDVPAGELGETAVDVVDELETATDYVWRARAFDGRDYGPFVVGLFEVSGENEPPSAPVVVFPLGDDVIQGEPVLLQWTNSVDPDPRDVIDYAVDVANDEDFEEIIASLSNIHASAGETTSTLLTLALTAGDTQYWRVSATDGFNVSDYGEGSFHVIAQNRPPSAPTAIDPLSGSYFEVEPDTPIELRVANADDPDGHTLAYQFQVSMASTMTPLVFGQEDVSEGSTETFVEMTNAFDGSFFWRARANDGISNGPWSDVQSFQVVVQRPQEDVGTDTGDDVGVDTSVTQTSAPVYSGGGGCTSAPLRRAPLTALLALVALVWRRRRAA